LHPELKTSHPSTTAVSGAKLFRSVGILINPSQALVATGGSIGALVQKLRNRLAAAMVRPTKTRNLKVV
jgi:hypothetical protein